MDDFSSLGMGFGLKPQGKAAPMSRPSISAVSNGGDRSTLFDDVFGGPPKYTTGKSTSSFSDFDYNSIFKTSSSNHTNNNNKNNQNFNSNRDKSASSRVSYDENVFATISNDIENRNYSVDNTASPRFSYGENVFAKISNDKENRNNYSVENSASARVSYNEDEFATMFNENLNRNKCVDELGSSRVSYDENVFSTKSNGGLDRDHSYDELDSSRVRYEENVFVTMENDEKRNDGVGLDELLENLGRSERVDTSSNNGTEGFDDLLPGFGVTGPQRSSRAESESSQSKQTSNNSNKPTSSVTDDPFVVLESPPENQSSKVFPGPLDEISKLGNLINTKDNNNSSTGDVIFDNIDPLDGFGKFAPVSSEINREDFSSRAGLSNDSDDNFQELHETIFEMPSTSTDSCKIGEPMASPAYVNVEFNEKDSYAEIPSESDVHIDSSDDAWLNVSEIPLFTHPTSAPPPSRPPPSVPAAMKEATDRAEAKFRQSKEVRERECANTTRDGENPQVKKDEQERENSENEERLESERRQRKEEEHRRLKREREIEMARQAVERATREARERAVSEARGISEREAVQRMQAEARRRAAEIAKEKAEKEAKERANAEIRDNAVANARAEQATVDRAAAEARERAANVVRINQPNNENARTNQQNNENARMNLQSNENVRMSQQHGNVNDLESFFNTNSRPSSVPRPRDSAVDPVFQSRVESEPNYRTSSVNTTASVRKTSSANLFDDLSSIFGGTSLSDDFQDVDGETEERRRTRLDRHQRTQERVAKALAEKNERDLQSERDQEERHRIGETLDTEIGEWAAGKKGNLRALLSTMQYVLWPECGWTPVSLTDLITGASVKKVYRKATLCIHPDKVQQKGANLQQKYIAEKVFDLLKEAWNKFNSEELF